MNEVGGWDAISFVEAPDGSGNMVTPAHAVDMVRNMSRSGIPLANLDGKTARVLASYGYRAPSAAQEDVEAPVQAGSSRRLFSATQVDPSTYLPKGETGDRVAAWLLQRDLAARGDPEAQAWLADRERSQAEFEKAIAETPVGGGYIAGYGGDAGRSTYTAAGPGGTAALIEGAVAPGATVGGGMDRVQRYIEEQSKIGNPEGMSLSETPMHPGGFTLNFEDKAGKMSAMGERAAVAELNKPLISQNSQLMNSIAKQLETLAKTEADLTETFAKSAGNPAEQRFISQRIGVIRDQMTKLQMTQEDTAALIGRLSAGENVDAVVPVPQKEKGDEFDWSKSAVVKVIDGDGVVAITDESDNSIRLYGFNAPEGAHLVGGKKQGGQPYGAEAKAFLEKLLSQGEVEFGKKKGGSDTEAHGRLLRSLRVRNGEKVIDVAREMIAAGFGYAGKNARGEYDVPEYAKVEAEARKAGRGMWQDSGHLLGLPGSHPSDQNRIDQAEREAAIAEMPGVRQQIVDLTKRPSDLGGTIPPIQDFMATMQKIQPTLSATPGQPQISESEVTDQDYLARRYLQYLKYLQDRNLNKSLDLLPGGVLGSVGISR